MGPRASATAGAPSRRRSFIPPSRSVRRRARRRGASRRVPSTASGRRPPIGRIRSSCWRSRLLPRLPSWCRSGTGGCWSRRSRSSAGPRYPMAADLAAGRGPGWTCSSAAMRTSRTSARSVRPTAGSCSASTTSTRRCPGPFEWDVKRLAASFAVAGRDRGFDAKQRAAINGRSTRAYREAMREFAGDANLDLWYSRIDVDEIADLAAAHGVREAGEAVRAQRREGAVEGQPQGAREAHRDRRRRARIASDPPLIVPIEEMLGRRRGASTTRSSCTASSAPTGGR